MLLKKKRIITTLSLCLTLFLLLFSTNALALGAKVSIPETTGINDPINIKITPEQDNTYFFIVVIGPFEDKDYSGDPTQLDYIGDEDPLSAGAEVTISYPEDEYDWVSEGEEASTGTPGYYLVIVALSDVEFDTEDILDYIMDFDVPGLMEYFLGLFPTWTQLTAVSVFVIPEASIGTLIGVFPPLAIFAGLKIHKRYKKARAA